MRPWAARARAAASADRRGVPGFHETPALRGTALDSGVLPITLRHAVPDTLHRRFVAGYSPHRSAAVCTGASQSDRASSSISERVAEQPAMSRDVT